MDSQDIIKEGVLAQAAINDPAISLAFDELDQELRAAMFSTSPAESTRREELYNMVINLEGVKQKLAAKIQNATFEKEQLAQDEE